MSSKEGWHSQRASFTSTWIISSIFEMRHTLREIVPWAVAVDEPAHPIQGW